ncbi:ubiquinol-cytochrome c reductase iron-sulfur subunit [Amycolatopsis regifaucium]|uniref:Cytochrome bc1 complex Rieske iron-sulfur subunit n=1 Tax=Amycolatopsis regifaucium TaxID=546365 RepID=A0A154M886_9PSEU|nr:Rieske (2Fe-2S) protein [Amycolatopsis regifaucium]KZB80756.1 ferredoxin [Amycolatopsis regifaucium]OKA07884.1 ferredoxin [Amycolatopsis regifaucium]
MTAELHSRRTVLSTGAAVAGVAVGAVTLTACGSEAPSSGSAAAPPVAAPGETLTALSDLEVGQAKAAKTADGKDVIVTRTAEGTAAAFSAICTHQGCAVVPAGAELNCPCHNSIFDAATGAVKKGPADKPLPSIAVRVANGQVVTA